MLLDFTSALYLGMRHASRSLEPWEQLTTGVPSALADAPGTSFLTRSLAALQGCERATLAPSTLHIFWDLFVMLADSPVVIYTDAGTYPIARWGIERAAARGVPVRSFRHHDADALRRLLRAQARGRPVVVTDGFCPSCGREAPLADYLRAAREHSGRLIIDDTQAAGIYGESPGEGAPYGTGGGGMLRWHNLRDTHALVVSSLAKGFGVPLAVLSGASAAVEDFEEMSKTRVHCSPPSVATLHALKYALALNREHGDALRLRLAGLVRHFRRRLAECGLAADGNLFPVQTLAARLRLDAVLLHERLQKLGIKTVLHRPEAGRAPRLSFIINARHSRADLDTAVSALASHARTRAIEQKVH